MRDMHGTMTATVHGDGGAPGSEGPTLAERVACAIEEAGNILYSLVPGGVVGSAAGFVLTYADGSGSFDFEDARSARQHVHECRRLAMANAALRVVTGNQRKARCGPWKVVVSDWGYPNILPYDGAALAADSVAEFLVRQQMPESRERAIALAEHFVAAANIHAEAALGRTGVRV